MNARTCTHGMPSPKSCIDCMNDDGLDADPKPPVEIEFVFTARYDGHCGECNLPTAVGQRLAKLTTGAYVHEGCAP